MPYPPRKPRKHPDKPVGEARTQHLAQYKFKPGQSGNPSGMSKSQRELHLEARGLVHQAGPGAIRRLAELAGIPLNGEAWTALEHHEIDPRVVYMAATALADRAYGKPQDSSHDSGGSVVEAEPSISQEERRRQANAEIAAAFPERYILDDDGLVLRSSSKKLPVPENSDPIEERQRSAREEIDAAFPEKVPEDAPSIPRDFAADGPLEGTPDIARLPVRHRPLPSLGKWSG